MGRNKYLQKTNGKKKTEEEEEPSIKMPKGCPCPGLKGCLIGEPVTEGEESLIMICSATQCPFYDVPIHKSCFEKYEDQLIKMLGEKGSARGWTEYKARRNLWKPCGQGLIVMHCRCLCEKGNVQPTEDVINSERILVSPCDGDKRKRINKKNLPIINMNGGANAKQARMQARFAREEMIEEERNPGREFYTPPATPRRPRNNSVTSFSSQSIISTSSNNRTALSSSFAQEEDTMHRGRGARGRRGGRRRDESRSRLDSGVSVKTPLASPVRECNTSLMPADTPPPMTRSYAATIVNPLPKASKSSEAISTSNAVNSFNSSRPSVSNHWNVGIPTLMCERWYTSRSIQWEIATRGHYDPEILLSHERSASYFLPSQCRDHIEYPAWNPWDGKDFNMGQFTIAGIDIPKKK